MTKFTTTLLLTVLTAATAMASPFPDYTLSPRQDASNCTQYCSVSAGCVCRTVPSDCTEWYTVQSGDTCTSIAQDKGDFTVSQLYKWNPDMGRSCMGLRAFVPICVATPWYAFTPPVQADAGAHATEADTPVPIMPGIRTASCQEYEMIGSGTRVETLAEENGFNVEDFAAWNGNQTTAWAGYWACVKA